MGVSRRLEVIDCRAVQDLALGVEARAVARAVPALLCRVPADDALEVCAESAAVVHGPAVVAICRDLVNPAANDASLATRNVVLARARRQKVLRVLNGDVDVFLR